MTTIRELITKLGFEVEHEKLSKLEEQLEGVKRRLEFLAAAEIAKGLFELTERFSKFAEEIHVAAASAGITVEAIQKLGFAAGQSAISQDELGGAMARLSRHLYEAKNGSAEAQKAFLQAGLSAGQIQGFKTGQDALLALADRFKAIDDPIKKQALAMQLLGRGSVNMVGFLSKGSGAIKGLGTEAERLGVILSEHQVEALVEVEHAMQKLWSVIKAIGATVAANLAPSLRYATETLLNFYAANQKLITDSLSKWIYNVLYGLGFLFGVLETVIKKIYEFSKSHQTIFRLVEAFLILGVGIIAVNLIAQQLITVFVALAATAETALGILTSPFTVLALLIGAVVVAVHDLWEGIHGRPTWLGSFIEWLGIGKEVQEVCFAIFDIIQDIFSLDFSKLFKDVLGDAKSLGGVLFSVFDKVGSIFGKSSVAPSAAGFAGALQNMQSAPGLLNAPSDSALAGGAGGAGAAGGVQQYSINAPINIEVPHGTDHKVVGDKVKEGVKEHLDRVYRETQRSLRPVKAY